MYCSKLAVNLSKLSLLHQYLHNEMAYIQMLKNLLQFWCKRAISETNCFFFVLITPKVDIFCLFFNGKTVENHKILWENENDGKKLTGNSFSKSKNELKIWILNSLIV